MRQQGNQHTYSPATDLSGSYTYHSLRCMLRAAILFTVIALFIPLQAYAISCYAKGDIWYSNDESRSIDDDEARDSRAFIHQVIERFYHDADYGVQSGVVGWSTYSIPVVMPLSDTVNDPDDSRSSTDGDGLGIREIYTERVSTNSGTSVSSATRGLSNLIKDSSNGGREDVPQVAVIMTDLDFTRESYRKNTWLEAAADLREDASIILILIDGAARSYNTSSSVRAVVDEVVGDSGHLFTPSSYSDIADDIDRYITNVTREICSRLPTSAPPQFDYGDAPTSGAAPDGLGINSYGAAKHNIVRSVYLGDRAPDSENSNQASTNADGDDTNGSDDDDGVNIPTLKLEKPATITVNATGDGGYLQGWIDWNGDGDFFDLNERIAYDQQLINSIRGTINLTVTPPATAITSAPTFARFRWSTTPGLGTTTNADDGDGEVEDYRLTIQPDNARSPDASYDSSDAPADGSTSPNGGTTNYGEAHHVVTDSIQLGTAGNGADNDGVNIPELNQGESATITVNATGANGYLQGWIDWNGDGDFADAGEQIATDMQLSSGTTGTINVPVSVPASATANETFARFRWSTTAGLDSTASTNNGEVEDYILTINPVITGGSSSANALTLTNTTAKAIPDNQCPSYMSIPISVNDNLTITDLNVGINLTHSWRSDLNARLVSPQGTRITLFTLIGGRGANLDILLDDSASSDIGALSNTPTHNTSAPYYDNVFNLEGSATLASFNGENALGNWSLEICDDYGADTGTVNRVQLDFKGEGTSAAVDTLDYSDALALYGVASHTADSFYLGSTVDSESAAHTSANALGDDSNGSDDDDGVNIPALTQGTPATISVKATGAGGYLQSWIDWNGDGDFFDSSERIAYNQQLSSGNSGIINLAVTPPATAITSAPTFARFRWSTTAGLDSTTAASDGEVEDYRLSITSTTTPPTPPPTSGHSCTAKADIWYANDESGSIDDLEFDQSRDFIYQVIDSFYHSSVDGVQSGILSWGSDTVDLAIPITDTLHDAGDSGLHSTGISTDGDGRGIREKYTQRLAEGMTRTDLTLVTQRLTTLINGGNGRRTGVPQIAVILTDAANHQLSEAENGGGTPWLTAANNLRNAGPDGTRIVIVLIDQASNAYNIASTKAIVDQAAGANGLVIQATNYADAADEAHGHISQTVNDICSVTTTPGPAAGIDYGDAPVSGSAPSGSGTNTYGAASHTIVSGTYLGSGTPDAESANQPSASANGDDTDGNDDDDGVSIPALTQGTPATISVNASGAGGYLQGWIDWNGDGDFFDSNERIAYNQQLNSGNSGTINLTVTPPANAVTSATTFARFRWSTTAGLGSTTAASDGEVEDYPVTIVNSSSTSTGCSPNLEDSYFHNPDFESYSSLPTTFSQMNRLNNWEQATSGTTDFLHSDGYTGDSYNHGFDLSNLITNGGAVATITRLKNSNSSQDNYVEYVGQCLKAPLEAGTTYQLKMAVAQSTLPGNVRSGTIRRGGDIRGHMVVLGRSSCPTGVMSGSGDRYNTSGFPLLGQISINQTAAEGWRNVSIDLTPTSDMPYIMIGLRRNTLNVPQSDIYGNRIAYTVYDKLIVNEEDCFTTSPDRSDTPANNSTAPNGANTTSYGEAQHTIVSGIRLGAAIDADDNSIASAAANGDGADDDGVNIPSLTQGTSATISVNATGAGGYLQGWIDWNGDGDFTDAGERVATNRQLNSGTSGTININVTPPTNAITSAPTFARFRWSTTAGLGSTTTASNGEVEDYRLSITSTTPPPVGECVVNVDALASSLIPNPDFNANTGLPTTYSTSSTSTLELASNWFQATIATTDYLHENSYLGAHNGTVSPDGGGFVGVIVDEYSLGGWTEYVGTELTSPMAANTEYTFNLQVGSARGGTPSTLGGAFTGNLVIYGVEDAGDLPLSTIGYASTFSGVDLLLSEPLNIAGGAWETLTGSFTPTKAYEAILIGGENNVGGYLLFDALVVNKTSIVCEAVSTDYGDAPVSGSAPNGSGTNNYGAASHTIVSGTYLGSATPDEESANQPSANANGDDTDGNNDDDGVSIPTLSQGISTTVSVNATGAGGYLQGWIDWNGDGDFTDSGEQVATNRQLSSGTSGTINFTVTPPANAITSAPTFARFRWSTTAGLGSTTAASDGEVEDYAFTISATGNLPPFTCSANFYEVISGQLTRYNLQTEQYDPIGADLATYNATGYNSTDNYIYGVTNTGWGSDAHRVIRVGSDGNYELLHDVSSVTSGAGEGTIIGNTLFFEATENALQSIDLSTGAISSLAFSGTGRKTYDLSHVSTGGQDIVVGAVENELSRWNLTTGVVDIVTVAGLPSDGTSNAEKRYGASWGTSDGLVYFSRNSSGTIYAVAGVETANPYVVNQYSGAVSSAHDGMNCYEGGHPFAIDFSDAPIAGTAPDGSNTNNYGSAGHKISTGIYLGAGDPDIDTTNQASANADGDDNDGNNDDDGVSIPALTQGVSATITVNATGTGGYLQGWIDWNGDGDFADSGEQVATNRQDNGSGADAVANDGTITFGVMVPTAGTTNQTFARFRWSKTSGLNTTMTANDGEVEDYALSVQAAIPPTINVGSCPANSHSNILFIVDNSGSISPEEFDDFSQSIQNVGNTLLSNNSSNQIAVAHFGGPSLNLTEGGQHIYIERDFSGTAMSAPVRQFGIGGNYNASWNADHLAAAIERMRYMLDNDTSTQSEFVVSSIRELSRDNSVPLQIIIMTDADRDFDDTPNDISMLIDPPGSATEPNDGSDYTAYNQLKQDGISFSVVSFNSASVDMAASAAIASVGGSFSGNIDANPADPEGSQQLPRRYVPVTSGFTLLPEQILEVAEGINAFCGGAISGTVFEDLNYGGGNGSAFGAAGTTGLSGTSVEVYDTDGNYIGAVQSAADGSYQLPSMPDGNYFVRIVNGSVTSSRPGSNGNELAVMTYRSDGVNAVSNEIGGRYPDRADATHNNDGSQLNTATFIFNSGSLNTQPAQSVQPITISGGGDVANANFGFNFNTVVNTNDAGQGSLRQFVQNNNLLSSTGIQQNLPAIVGSDYQSGDAVAAFMIPTVALSSGEAIIDLADTLRIEQPGIVIDGRVQSANIGSGAIILQGNNTGLADGVYLSENAGGSGLREITINNFGGSGVIINGTGKNQNSGASLTQLTLTNNGGYGILLENGAVNNQIIASQIKANNWAGIANDANPVNTFSQNSLSDNGGLGIDLGVDGVTANSNVDSWLNYPEVAAGSSISSNGTQVVAYDFDLEVPPSTYGYRIEFFSNTVVDPSGHGEGETYLGYADIQPGGSGLQNYKGSINANQTVAAAANIAVTLTAKTGANSLGSTSEFSGVRNGGLSVCTDLLADPGASGPTVTIEENSPNITYLEALDANGYPITYAISGGADADKFVINPVPPGALFDCLTVEFIKDDDIISTRSLAATSTTRNAQAVLFPGDYEAPTDNGSDNTYDLIITATDVNNNSVSKPLTVTVLDVNEKPRITTPATVSYAERQDTVVVDLEAYDPDAGDAEGAGLSYRISSGADASRFSLDALNGELRFNAPPDYGNPADQNGDNRYEITVKVMDAQGYSSSQSLFIIVTDDPANDGVSLSAKALLQGAFDSANGLMSDNLRSIGILPVTQPYNRAPFNYAGVEQVNLDLTLIEGNEAMVDWVLLELRAATDPQQVIAAKAALIQRDGDLMDAATGAAQLNFPTVAAGEYYLSLRHRNHLGVITAAPLALSGTAENQIDFSHPDTAMQGDFARLQLAANDSGEELALLWSGDINHDDRLILNGTGSDLIEILSQVLNTPDNTLFNSSYQASGYHDADINMDGVTLFTGPGNDGNILLGNVLLHPANSAFVGNYIISGGLAQ